MKRMLAVLVLALSAAVGLAACSASDVAPERVTITAETVVIDVRTSAEYAESHLEGAINIDAQSDAFDSLVSALPADGDYVVYCSTGNRSGAAVSRMTELGFTTLADAGGFEEASASTGLAIVGAP
ncbi:hypothetical protein GY21_06250 [Cryobacterium roopkundense]|uniref:Rhodanese-related sulfurtransferase n=1 Tax=Cryobacterium roopkundense TaxID=1001240 RepID=A0A099JLU3_9MICO|nr:rhodanese-like domain-containing protein [Cryobacterium roopkundense]KGJ79126.1 hypothetical protein GY21_06250 [Cryobacterium roopkundense]MBB5643255.1 rhodanese-related sulfurtransferase [Cryobacterium roopkundense]